jgi:hypothetical protein
VTAVARAGTLDADRKKIDRALDILDLMLEAGA